MKRYSTNYINCVNNYIIKNIKSKDVSSEDKKFISSIKVVKNILSRGNPTKVSSYLKDKYQVDIDEKKYIFPSFGQVWFNTIKGTPNSLENIAFDFLYKYIDKYIPEYSFIKYLILPEASIEEITQQIMPEYKNCKVDFYLPQDELVIEIDGIQHSKTSLDDNKRNELLKKNGIDTIRIDVQDIKKENKNFIHQLDKIKYRLQNNEIINNYKNNIIDVKSLELIYISRVQIIILELLLNGYISLSDKVWDLRFIDGKQSLIEYAINDLRIWINRILNLQKIYIDMPKVNLSKNADIVIDLNIIKRYSDELNNDNIIYCYNDYFDERNYFELETSTPINYNINENDLKEIQILKDITFDIFGFKEFKDGQLPIILNMLNQKNTIGLLPTGTGKSLCYQLSVLLEPSSCLIICPLKSLIRDQYSSMKRKYISNTSFVDSSQTPEEKESSLNDIVSLKSIYNWISPERLQTESFRNSLSNMKKINYVVLDEVHCMSIWGHDFRISYLQLTKTIKKIIPNVVFVGLTATASLDVLNDILIEFGISRYNFNNVKSIKDFTRKELSFNVIHEEKSKLDVLKNSIKMLYKNDYMIPCKEKTKSVLVFTPFARGKNGVSTLKNELSKIVPDNYLGVFSGKNPFYDIKDCDYDEMKMNALSSFKNNDISLLVATKSFGMGIDKPNIREVIHYGIPNSLEEYYQEAGRAGRDGNPSTCTIIHSIRNDKSLDNELFTYNFDPSDKKYKMKFGINDFTDQLQLMTLNGISIKEEFDIIKEVLKKHKANEEVIFKTSTIIDKYENGREYKKVVVNLGNKNVVETSFELIIYKLYLLGIIKDWIIDYKSIEKYHILFNYYDDNTVIDNLNKFICNYEYNFDIDNIDEDNYKVIYRIMNSNNTLLDKYIYVLCYWYYEKITYRKYRNLKYFDELVENFTTSENFQTVIYNYFKLDYSSEFFVKIKEEPYELKNIFRLLHRGNNLTYPFLEKTELEILLTQLERFLTENRHVTGYNLLNGLIKLSLNTIGDYEEDDLVKAIKVLYANTSIKEELLNRLIDVYNIINLECRDKYINLLLKIFKEHEELVMLYDKFKCDQVFVLIMNNYKERIKLIERRLLGNEEC